MLKTGEESKSNFGYFPEITERRTNILFDDSRGLDTVSSASFLFGENHQKFSGQNIQTEIETSQQNDTTIRSSSLVIRAKKDGVGYRNGFLRLLEHDKHSDSSENTDYRAHFSFIDDPNLEINIH